jgi:hypothetical protein
MIGGLRYVLLILVLLAGCGLIPTEENRPKVLLEMEHLRTRYMADHDEVTRQTAAAVLRCRATLLDDPLVLRTKCASLDRHRAEWEKHDTILRNALVYDTMLRATDWERALEAATKFKVAAEDVVQYVPPTGFAPAAPPPPVKK